MLGTAAYWHVEHASFERLLDFLEGQLNVFQDGARPNHELMLDVASFLRHFAPRCHRSREETAFAFIVQSAPGMRTKIDRLLEEHHVIAAKADELYTRLSNVHAGDVAHREEVEAALATYVTSYRHHITAEEASRGGCVLAACSIYATLSRNRKRHTIDTFFDPSH